MIDKAEYGIQEVDPKGTALILDGQRPATKMRTGQEPSVPYELRPPKWITKATRDGDLGYHAFYPPRPGQDEDVLSETNIRYGYQEPHFVAGELWQGTDTFGGIFKQQDKNGLESLQDIMERVLAKRAELHATVEENVFKLPARVTLAGDKRIQWYADLANPEFPLQKLAKHVPHGKKDQELLELLFSNNTPVDRAVWYIRCLGAIEIQARNKSNAQPVTSIEWTNIVTSHIKKQLLDIAMPTTLRTGTNIKQSFKKSKLNDPEWKDKWVERFAYSLDLLHLLFDSELLDQPTLLTWLTTTSSVSEGMAPHQFIFLVRLAHEYFDILVASSSARQYATYILDDISSLMLRMFTENSDLFMNRIILSTHASTLQDMLLHAIQQLDIDLQPKIKEEVMSRCEVLIDRGNAIISIELPQDDEALEVQTRLEDIATLNSIDISTNLTTFLFLPPPNLSPTGSFDLRPFSRRISILLSWATHANQSGSRRARPYCAAAFIALWKTQAAAVLPNANQMLQRHLLAWLEERGFLRPKSYSNFSESSEVSMTKEDVDAIAVLFGDLVRRKLFSFPDYLTRMASFGQGSAATPKSDHGSSSNMDESPGFPTALFPDHLELLRHLPLWDKISEQLLNQRKIVLHGIRAKKTSEDAMEKEIRAELRRVVPIFFNGPPPQEEFSKELIPKTLLATKFIQARVIYHWLFDLVKDYVARAPGSSAQQPIIPVSVYCTLIQLFSWTACFPAMFELNNLILAHTMDDDLLLAALNSIRQFLNIWVGMMQVDKIVDCLLEANFRLREQTRKSPKHLLMLLSELDKCCVLMPVTSERIHSEVAEAMKALVSDAHSSSPAMPILPLIQAAIQENSLEQPDDLATTLWYRNRKHGNWGTESWHAMISAIEMRSWNTLIITDIEMARRFATLGWNIDNHLPDGIEEIVSTWFEASGAEKMVHAPDEVWEVVKELCFQLVLSGVISPVTVLKGLVYPAWTSAQQSIDGNDLLRRHLGRSLGLMDTMICYTLPPSDLGAGDSLESQLQMETCRTRCLHPSNLLEMIAGLSTLAVIESDPGLDPNIRQLLEQFRNDFQENTFVQEEILSRTKLLEHVFDMATKQYPAHEEAFIANLRGCLRLDCTSNLSIEGEIDAAQWATVLKRADLWNFARLALDFRLFLKQWFTRSNASSQGHINPSLEALASAVFDRPLSPSNIALMSTLLTGVKIAIAEHVVTRGLRQLALCFASSPKSSTDDTLSFLSPSKGIFRLTITFYRSIDTHEQVSWESRERDEFLRCWNSQMTFFKELLETRQNRAGPIMHEVADAICFMLRILHFFIEFVSSEWGSDMASEAVGLISLLVQFAIMFGGSLTADDITFSLLVDTACVFMDGCSRETKQLITKALSERFPINGLPEELPNSSRQRLTSILPFNPMDKLGANIARAQRNADGTLSYASKARGRPWEWMDSIETRDTPSLISTKVKNTSAMPLELFETTSKGENIISGGRVMEATAQMEDIWSFRDHTVSEGLIGRNWRESKAAWDARSLDGSERVGSSIRELSPAASRTSAPMSTSSRKASPSLNISGKMQPLSVPSVETIAAEPIADARNTRGLKRKERVEDIDDDDDDIVMTGEKVGGKTTQLKRGKGKGKIKR